MLKKKNNIVFIVIIILCILLSIVFLLWSEKKSKQNNEGQKMSSDINVTQYQSQDLVQLENNQISENIEQLYQKQFLDEISTFNISTHFGFKWYADNSDAILALKDLGIKKIRDDIRWELVQNNNKEYNFNTTDKWINKLQDNGILIQAILGYGTKNQLGDDYIVSNEEELNSFLEYVEKIVKRYPNIKEYELWNEPNARWTSDEQINWYVRTFQETSKILKDIDKDITLIAGATMTPNTDEPNRRSSEKFIEEISKKGVKNYTNSYSYHLYDWDASGTWNYRYHNFMKSHTKLFNDLGGFTNKYLTETGIPSANNKDEQQVKQIIQQAVIINKYGIKEANLYTLRNTGESSTINEDNFGLINNDYTPKPSYYSMKNYYENTNGSEYIGAVNIAEGLEAHVYNKDGKPKIVAWSNNSNKNIEIDYLDFTAKDIYGNNIENTNGKLTITTSPVYLDNISEKYYYMAISKTATEKYNEFENKYIEEIKKVTNLNTNIQTMKKYMAEVGNATLGVPEDLAKKAMQQHYTLGKNILDAYKNGELKVEHVKLSSMLDSLDDIGNSYEDLVTVSSKIRNAELNKANDQIKEVENIINSNIDLEIIYPEKILEFSKDYHEKSSYINGLQEENDIKTGLIVSKNMHSIELSNWAKLFTNIYIEEHIKNNPITVNYSQAEITNKDVQVTLNISEDCKVTNNNENNVYTFVENGEFTFEYTRRGRNFSEKVSVNNIDKKAPEIKGVEGWKVYTGKAIPIVTDENLEKVELILNGQVVDGYKEGTEITEEGIYQITATDKAGNISRVNFEVIENIEKGYKIEKGYIKNITGSTQKTDFENQLPIKYKYTIKRNEKEIDKDGIVATGDMLEIEGKEKYTLIVNGDINKDGIVSILDLVKIKRQILGELKLEGIEKQAADANQDGKEIGIKDLVRMRILILSRGINN